MIAIVSSDSKEEIARRADADHVPRFDGRWREEAREVADGGVDAVVDPAGGERFLDTHAAMVRLGCPDSAALHAPSMQACRLKVCEVAYI